jgi:DNA-binding NtrC family response regulator
MIFPQSIAIVEDEKDILTLFTEIIRQNGYPVVGYANPISFVRYLRTHQDKFILILIDYKMPQMTGCELANQITKINPNVKMVLMTAANDILNNNLNLELIHKPIKINELVQIISRYMRHTMK